LRHCYRAIWIIGEFDTEKGIDFSLVSEFKLKTLESTDMLVVSGEEESVIYYIEKTDNILFYE
jgi:hypothetical protein